MVDALFVGVNELIDSGPYTVMLLDPPWHHYGSTSKWAAAGKYYPLLTDDQLKRFPIRSLLDARAVVFCWVTSNTVARAIDVHKSWGLHYRGVAFVWIKVTRTGEPFGAAGVRPSIVKPLTEFVLAFSNVARGRPIQLASEAVEQTIFASRGRHSEKPVEVYERIERLYPLEKKVELFARNRRNGWKSWGNEL